MTQLTPRERAGPYRVIPAPDIGHNAVEIVADFPVGVGAFNSVTHPELANDICAALNAVWLAATQAERESIITALERLYPRAGSSAPTWVRDTDTINAPLADGYAQDGGWYLRDLARSDAMIGTAWIEQYDRYARAGRDRLPMLTPDREVAMPTWEGLRDVVSS